MLRLLQISNKNILILKFGIPIAISGIAGAIVGAIIANKLDVVHLKKYFGIFLGLIAIWEIYSLVKKYRETKKRHNKDVNLNVKEEK